jgi:hypothetical protein
VPVAAQQDVVENRHAAEELDELERARDTVSGDAVRREPVDGRIAEEDPPGGRGVEAADAVQETRLAGAVGPDQGGQRARGDRHADSYQRAQPLEFEAHIVDG